VRKVDFIEGEGNGAFLSNLMNEFAKIDKIRVVIERAQVGSIS
jgi:hypothetical protein